MSCRDILVRRLIVDWEEVTTAADSFGRKRAHDSIAISLIEARREADDVDEPAYAFVLKSEPTEGKLFMAVKDCIIFPGDGFATRENGLDTLHLHATQSAVRF